MPKRQNSAADITTAIPPDALALLNVAQAQTILCISRGTLYNLIRSGEIKPIKIRSSTRFRRSEIDRFISARTAQSSSQN
jgi:excisionase family DNA binding protein